MRDRFFLDTNVLVYAEDAAFPAKRLRAHELLREGIRSEEGVISTQVLCEFFVTATRKTRARMSLAAAQRGLDLFRNLEVVQIDAMMVFQAIDLHISSCLHFWDALILVTAAHAGCNILYTEDMNAGQVIEGVRIVNPFL